MENLAYRITLENIDMLSYVTGKPKEMLNANLNWIVYRHISNVYRWHLMPEVSFREEYPYLEIQNP